MNNEEYFDKEVKAKAERHAEVPPQEVWERIREKRKKRVVPFWFSINENKLIFSIALLTVIAGGVIYQNINKQTGNNPIVIDSEKKSVVNSNSSKKIEKNESAKIQNLPGIKTNEISTSNTENTTNLKHSHPSKEITHNNLLIAEVKPPIANQHTSQQKDIIKNSYVKPELNEVEKHNAKDSIVNLTGEENGVLTTQGSLILATKTNELLFDNDSASVNIKSDSSLTTPPRVTDSLNTKWSVEIMYGYDVIQNKFSAANGNQNYFNILNEQEKINNGFSMNLKVGYNLNPRLKIKSGFSYSYLSSTFNYEYVERTIATYTGMINAYIISPFNPPQQITFYGTRIDTLEMSYAFNHSKKFKYYNIPLTVNYYLPVKKFKLGAGAGIGFNLVTEVTGEYLQSDLKTESELNNNGQSPYKSSYRFYGIGNISVCFQLNKKIYLMAEPELRIPLSTITKTDAEIKQKINTLSLQTGFGINF